MGMLLCSLKKRVVVNNVVLYPQNKVCFHWNYFLVKSSSYEEASLCILWIIQRIQSFSFNRGNHTCLSSKLVGLQEMSNPVQKLRVCTKDI